MQTLRGTRALHLGAAVALLAVLALAACGGGDDAAQASTTSAPASAGAPGDLHIEGRTAGFKWSSGLASITASTDVVTAGVFGAGCAASATSGLQLPAGTAVAIGAHVDDTGHVVADRIACAAAAGFAFDPTDTRLHLLGDVTYSTGVFGKLVPESVTVQSPPIDTTRAETSGCELDANLDLPDYVTIDAHPVGDGYVAWRVRCR